MIAMTIAISVATQARDTQEEGESFGDRIKRLFTGPSPTPHQPFKKAPAKKKTTPRPSPKTALESPFPPPSATLSLETASSTAPGIAETSVPQAFDAKPDYFEPVRPISPGPNATPRPARARRTPTPAHVAKPRPSPTVTPNPSTVTGEIPAPSATISAGEISGYENYAPEVRKIIDLGLSLTTQNLKFRINSADPINGGMDASGFVYYVLSQCGIGDVPRDAREQYVWARKAGTFQAVLGRRDDSFELELLKPGDLLFWASAYNVNREPDISQTMIYLGRERTTNQRIMMGASEGRTYKGRSHLGVSVFDFKVARLSSKSEKEPGPVFVGYAHIPGLPAE